MVCNRIILTIAMLLGVLVCAPSALALELKPAKDKGLVGEGSDGYLVVLESPAGDDVRRLAVSINKQRKESYKEQAKNEGIPERIIRERAFQRIYETMPSGNYYQDADGSWKQR